MVYMQVLGLGRIASCTVLMGKHDATQEQDFYVSYSTEIAGSISYEVGYICTPMMATTSILTIFADFYVSTSVAGIVVSYYITGR